MTQPYIPSADANALTWMNAFSSGISANFAAFQLTQADADAIAQAVAEFQQAYSIATQPGTRTVETVNAKDVKRNAAEALCRQYAVGIKINAGIDDSLKLSIGVRPVNENREPIYCPMTVPLINVVAATPGVHTITFADSLDPNKRAKPFGAAAIQLYLHMGDEATTDENLASFAGMFTRNPVGYEFSPPDDGKMATWFAKWVGKRGDTSPFSLPVSMRIAA